LETLSLAFLGHLVGDYILQTDWMAKNKKNQTIPCLIHCTLWAGSVALFTGWGWVPFIVLLVVHYIQDRTTLVRQWMNLVGQGQFATGPYAPWSMVIIDNTFHLLQIWLVWKFLA
jgi:hypothetical protein